MIGPIKARVGPAGDEIPGSASQPVSNSHANLTDGRPPPPTIHEEVPEKKIEHEDKGGHEKSVLQAKLTKLAIQIGYAGASIILFKHMGFTWMNEYKFNGMLFLQALPSPF